MKKLTIIIGIFIAITVIINSFQSCTTQREAVKLKSGAELWGENCIRCHNTPSPASFNNVDWETIGMHMQIRANLTKEETDKIVEFLKSAN